MKTFKQYLKRKNTKFFPWSGSFSEIRTGDQVAEATNRHGEDYDSDFHDHEHVKPRELSQEHIEALSNYCSAPAKGSLGHSSSGNMNAYLRNCSGDKKHGIVGPHHEGDVEGAVVRLSSVFTPNNTNRARVTTYGGIPPKYGEMLSKMEPGSHTHFPGFTSTSSYRSIARSFARNYIPHDAQPTENAHMVEYTINPGAGVSAAHHSTYHENEMVLNHGAKIEYSHTSQDDHGNFVHHVTVHADSKPLLDYGEFSPPKKL